MLFLLLVAFAALNVLDGWTTWQIFRFHKTTAVEQNRVMAVMINVLGLYWALLLFKISVVVGVWWLAINHPFDIRYMVLIDAGYAWAISHNWEQLQKHKQ